MKFRTWNNNGKYYNYGEIQSSESPYLLTLNGAVWSIGDYSGTTLYDGDFLKIDNKYYHICVFNCMKPMVDFAIEPIEFKVNRNPRSIMGITVNWRPGPMILNPTLDNFQLIGNIMEICDVIL